MFRKIFNLSWILASIPFNTMAHSLHSFFSFSKSSSFPMANKVRRSESTFCDVISVTKSYLNKNIKLIHVYVLVVYSGNQRQQAKRANCSPEKQFPAMKTILNKAMIIHIHCFKGKKNMLHAKFDGNWPCSSWGDFKKLLMYFQYVPFFLKLAWCFLRRRCKWNLFLQWEGQTTVKFSSEKLT